MERGCLETIPRFNLLVDFGAAVSETLKSLHQANEGDLSELAGVGVESVGLAADEGW